MNKDADMYFRMIAERFWKEELILTSCEKCKRKEKCFSRLNELANEKMTNELFEEVRRCNIRNRMLQE